MNQQINQKHCQVFLCTCPVSMPYSFARHSWFVVNDQGDAERWELLYLENKEKPEWGHVHKNSFSLFQGIQVFPFSQSLHWPTSIRNTVSGQPAQKLIKTIRSTPSEYPYADQYELLGPNSNTYTQWIINQHPELDLDLPWNTIGKSFME